MKNYQIMIAILIVIIFAVWFVAKEPQVAVKIYQSHATGGYVYCQTGTLPATTHEYLGTGKIGKSKAVACP